MKNYSYLILSILLNISYVYAQLGSVVARNLKCSNDGTVVLYVAGQENTLPNIEESRVRLQYLFRKVYKNQDGSNLLDKPKNPEPITKLEFQALKNETLGLVGELAIGDFAKSIALIFQSEYKLSREASWKLAYQYFAHALSLKLINNGKEITISPEIRRLMANKHKTLLQQLIEIDEHITNDLKSMILAGSEKQKLILVSHSQGNLFVNAAVQELNSDSTFTKRLPFIGNVQVASPSQYVGVNKKLHVTNSMDAILRLDNFFYTPLSSNYLLIQPLPDYRDLLDQEQNHGFLTTYLRGQEHGDFYIDPENGNLGQLKELVVQSIVDVAAKLDSNCSDILPKIKITYDSQNPYKLHFDATELAKTIPGAIITGNFKWSWGDGSENKTTVGAIATHVFPQFLTYDGILEIPLDTGTKEVPFIADLARFTGQTNFLNSNLGLNSNGESPVQSAMDLENNLYYFATNTGKLVSLNATTGAQVSMLPLNFQNIKWMSVTSDGDIALVDNSVFGIFTYNIVDPETGETLLSKLLTDENISNVEGFALDIPRNIFYFSIPTSDFSATLIALNSNTGTELAASSNYYYGGPAAGDNTIQLVASSVLINSDGWLIRNGGIYPAAPLGWIMPVNTRA
jgi:hypothetical protein